MAAPWNTGAMFLEMMQASCQVISSRTDTMMAAGRDPLNGDYAELGRMVPEKIAAFVQSGTSVLEDVHAVQLEALGAMSELAAIALKGGIPTLPVMTGLTARSARMVQRAAGSTDRMLAPYHRGATGNARRLAKGTARK